MSDAADHPAALSPEALANQCETTRTRRSGPGGQNRNKVETAVVLRHYPTGITAQASERRTQGENLRTAFFRLRVNLALGIRRPRPAEAVPSPLWQSRCGPYRITINPTHADFPALLAEALDVIEASEYDLKHASERLGCSPSQLIKLLKAEPRALAGVNEQRQKRGVRPYH